MSLINCVADDRAFTAGLVGTSIRLPDFGFDLVPENQSLLPFIDLTAALQCTLIVWHTVSGGKLCHLALFLEWQAYVLMLRSATISATVLPSAIPCRDPAMQSSDREVALLLRPFLHFSTPTVFLSWCHDFVFSGHMSLLVLGTLALVEMRANRILQLISLANAITGALLLLTTRSHYSVDIILAIIIVTLLFETKKYRVDEVERDAVNAAKPNL